MKNSKEATPSEHNQYTPEQNQLGLERLMFFSDAVFAIAITILVLEIRLPAGWDTADSGQLLNILGSLWHKYLAYLISFWVIGIYWLSHHRKFLLIKKFDHALLSLNLLLLMVIAFIPFPTVVISENSSRTATVFYALVMALGGLVLALLWLHAASNHRLIVPHLSKQQQRRELSGILAMIAIFLLSIGLAFIAEDLVRLCWTLIIPVSLFLGRRRETA